MEIGTRSMALLAVLLLITACSAPQQVAENGAAGSAKEAGRSMDHRAILDDPGRPEEEKEQDASRRALDVYAWLGIEPGMSVADVFCSGGYNTHLLSRFVGEAGKVFSVFEFYADKEAFDGQLYKVDALTERVKKNRLENVQLLTRLAELPESTIDATVIVRNYHDVEWVFKDLKRKDVVAALYSATRPGGVVGIVDVATDNKGWDATAHRLNAETVIEDFIAGGFQLKDSSDILANPDDDHATSGFEEGRYNLDRYLLKFEKPL